MNATAITTHTQREPEWFAAWFDSEHYHKLYAHRSDAEAARFIDARFLRIWETVSGVIPR